MENRKEVIPFSQVIEPGETKVFTERVKADGTITGVKGKFYQGQVLGLQVKPFLVKNGKMYTDLVSYPKETRQFLCGNDKPFSHDIAIACQNDDFIEIRVTNTNDFNCNLDIAIEIDYFGGKRRVV